MTTETKPFEVQRQQTYVPCVQWSWQPSKSFVVECVVGTKVKVFDPTGGPSGLGCHRWVGLRSLHETGLTKHGKDRTTGWRLHDHPPTSKRQDLCVACMTWVDVDLITEGMRYTWRGTCAPCQAAYDEQTREQNNARYALLSKGRTPPGLEEHFDPALLQQMNQASTHRVPR